MAKKKLVADPFFPDNNFDIPDFSVDFDEPKDDRKPIARVGKAVLRGAVMGVRDSAFIGRLAREALPPVYGEIADLTNQGTEGVRKLYNSATKEIKPSLSDLARSVNRLVPAENKRLKAGLKKVDLWASGDQLKRGGQEEKLQQEKNIALEVGKVFQDLNQSQTARDTLVESENRAERKIRDVIEQHRHRDSLSALNVISSSTQNLASYNSKITAAYQRKMLELQMRNYFVNIDNLKQNKLQSERQLAELKVITKNTALPEFVKLKQSEAWKEQLRNRFISEMNAGLFGKRSNFIRGFFERIGRSAKDTAINAAGMFAQGAGMADAASLSKDTGMSRTDKAEMAGEMVGGAGVQELAMRGGRKLREKLEGSPRAAKIVKDLEYNVRNAPQKITKYANDNSNNWNEGMLTKLFKGVLRAGLGSLSPDMRVQTDHLMNLDVSSGNTLRTGAQFTNQNSKSINEIIPGYLSRIFRELQVLRTGDTNIGLTSYDYTKNRFLDSGKVAKNILSQIANGSGKQANKERVDRIMGSIGADKELDKDARSALAEMLTSENFKGTELSPEFLTNKNSFGKNAKTKNSAAVIADLFSRYYQMQDGKIPDTLEASEKRTTMNHEMSRLGTDFNDARLVIQELINMGQYEELRAIGLVDENTRQINRDRLIELYNSDKSFKPKSYGVSAKHTLTRGIENATPGTGFNQPAQKNNLNIKPPQGSDKRSNPLLEALEKINKSLDAQSGSSAQGAILSGSNDNSFSTLFKEYTDKLVTNTGDTVQALTLIHQTLEAQIKHADEMAVQNLTSNNRFQEFIARFMSKDDPDGQGAFGEFKDGMSERSSTKEGAKERFDTLTGSLKNVYNKTIGRGISAIKPIIGFGTSSTKWWWQKAAKPAISVGVATAQTGGRITRNLVSRIRDIYVEGDPPDQPRLQVEKLKRGQYVDALSGDVIYRLHQLKNGVRDETGNIILSKEEIPKAYFRNARGGVVFVAREIFGSAWRGVGNFQQFMTNNVTKPLFSGLIGTAKFASRGIRNLFDQPQDIYVKGETEPTLLGITMKAGGYYSKTTQKPITRPSQIDGAVIDSSGDIVLSVEQLKKGIVDKYGNPIVSPLMNALRFGAGLAMGGLKLAGKIIGGIHNAMGKTFGGAGELLGNLMSNFSTMLGGGKSYDVLIEIRNLLDKRLPAMKKNKFLDRNGDGVRDGSAEDIERNRKSQVNEVDALKGGVVETGRENTFDRIARMAGEAKDTVSDWLGKGADLAGEAGDLGGGKRGRRKGSRTRLARMKMARAKEMAAKKAAAATEAAKAAGQKIGQTKGFQAGMQASKNMAAKAAETGAGKAAVGAGSKLAGLGSSALSVGTAAAGFMGRNALRLAGGAGLAYGAYSGVNNLMDGNYGSAALDLGLAGVSGAAMLGGGAGVLGLGSSVLGGLGAAAGAVVGGIGAVLSSPILLTGLAIGAVGYGGYKAYKWLTDPTKSPLQRLRLAQYGFGVDDSDYLGRVLDFEKAVMPFVSYDEGKANLQIPDKDANKLITIFGFKAQETEKLTAWLEWVQKRFKPVFLTHMSALNSMSKDTSLTQVDKLDGDIKQKFFDQVKMSNGPYNELVSPFPDLKSLAMGTRAVAFVTSEVEKKVKEDAEQDKNKKQTTLSTEGVAGATGVVAAASADQMRDRLGLNKSQSNDLNAAAIDKANESGFSSFMKEAWTNTTKAVPVLGAAVQTMSYVSDKVGKFLGMSVDADEAVRFKTYGLVKMDRLKVIALRSLEQFIQTGVKFEADGKAVWSGAVDDVLSKLKGDFGISDKKGPDAKLFVLWFNERFIPTYLNYRSWLFQATNSKDQELAEKALKPEDRVAIALKVGGCSVWSKTSSPWREYTLSTDSASIKENIQFLDDQVKNTELNQKAKKGDNKPATSGLGGALSGKPAEPVKPDNPVAKAAAAGKQEATPQVPSDAEKEPPNQAIFSGDSSAVSSGVVGKLTTAGGEVKDGNASEQFLAYYKNATLNGLNPEMLRLFRGMVQEYGELTGKKVRVNSGFRTFEDQAAEYKANPQKAAPPGNSLHEYGLAIDIDSATANDMEKLGLLRKYGFTRPVGGEPWHLEAAGIQTARDKAKKSIEAAAAMIKNGVGKGGGGWGTNPKAGKYSRNDGYAQRLLESSDASTTVAEGEMNGTGAGNVNGNRTSEVNGLLSQGGGTGKGLSSADMKPTGATGIDPAKGDAVANNSGNMPGQADGYKNAPAPGKGGGYMAVKDVISNAAKTVGVDEKAMVTKAALESSFNPNAKASKGSATGLYQFTSGTWDEMMQKYGKKYGIAPGTQPTDANANAILAAQYMKDNEKHLLKASPDGKLTDGDRYMAHFFGPTGATQMLRADPNSLGAMVLPKAAADNKETFYDKNGNPRTVGEIRKFLNNKTDTALAKHGIDASKFGTPTTQVASEPATGAATATTASAAQTTPQNPNIIKASFNAGPGIAAPKDTSIAPPVRVINPEAERVREEERQRMRAALSLNNNPGINPAQGIPVPVQQQTRVDTPANSSSTNSILSKQLEIQTMSKDLLEKIATQMNFDDLKKLIGVMSEKISSQSGSSAPAEAPQDNASKANNAFIERVPRPIGMGRMT